VVKVDALASECDEGVPPRWQAPLVIENESEEARTLDAGLDLSRKRLNVCLLSDHAEVVEEFGAPPDSDGLRGLARRVAGHGVPVRGVIESQGSASIACGRSASYLSASDGPPPAPQRWTLSCIPPGRSASFWRAAVPMRRWIGGR
jgi:hypothetical protein